MIVYVDTSALLNLYLKETDSGPVRRLLNEAAALCTHLITYAEMRAALARAVRTARVSVADHVVLVGRFEEDWIVLEIVAVDVPLIRRAGELAESFGLRGYDSVHLAAAERVCDGAGRPTTFALAAFDRRLQAGAVELGLTLLT